MAPNIWANRSKTRNQLHSRRLVRLSTWLQLLVPVNTLANLHEESLLPQQGLYRKPTDSKTLALQAEPPNKQMGHVLPSSTVR